MKKINAVLFLLVFSVFAFGQSPPKTVTEFYLALPTSVNGIAGTQDLSNSGFEDDFFFYSNERNESKSAIIKYRKSLIKIEDIKNGYLRIESDEWEGWVEIALFKKADSTYLVAISQVGCGPDCRGGVLFLTYKGGKWTNVTKQVFSADPSPDKGYYKLPRIGTLIEMRCGDDGSEICLDRELLDQFNWNEAKFTQMPITRIETRKKQ